jgi:hypothetical protein
MNCEANEIETVQIDFIIKEYEIHQDMFRDN